LCIDHGVPLGGRGSFGEKRLQGLNLITGESVTRVTKARRVPVDLTQVLPGVQRAMPGPTGEDTDDEFDVIDNVPAHPPVPVGGVAAARPNAEDEDDGIDSDLLLGASSHAAARCAASPAVRVRAVGADCAAGSPALGALGATSALSALLAQRCGALFS